MELDLNAISPQVIKEKALTKRKQNHPENQIKKSIS